MRGCKSRYVTYIRAQASAVNVLSCFSLILGSANFQRVCHGASQKPPSKTRIADGQESVLVVLLCQSGASCPCSALLHRFIARRIRQRRVGRDRAVKQARRLYASRRTRTTRSPSRHLKALPDACDTPNRIRVAGPAAHAWAARSVLRVVLAVPTEEGCSSEHRDRSLSLLRRRH